MHIAVILPFRPRGDAGLLQWTLDGYRAQSLPPEYSLSIHLGIDGPCAPEELPPTTGAAVRVFPRMGAAAVRNALVADLPPQADVLLFGNADARPDPDMVHWHARTLADLPPGSLVLGSAPWETAAAPTVFDAFLAETPAVFFYNSLTPGAWHDFRHVWTLNLSMRRADFVAAGGFHEQLRPVYFEDLALGYKLMGKEKKALWYEPRAKVLHRHPTTVDQYLDREELLGLMSPVLARVCAGAFGALHGTRDVQALARTYQEWVKADAPMHQWIYRRLAEWATLPADTLGQGEARARTLMTIYQMHIPLKRLAFRLGFIKGLKLAEDHHWLERSAEGLWRHVVAG